MSTGGPLDEAPDKEALVSILKAALEAGLEKPSFPSEAKQETDPSPDDWKKRSPTKSLRRIRQSKAKLTEEKIRQLREGEKVEERRRGWFDMPSSEITEDVKRDLEVLSMRGAFNPKRHYKSLDYLKDAQWVQIGTVADSPLDGSKGRLPNRLRKRTLTQQWMIDPEMGQELAKRFHKIQTEDAEVKRRRRHQFPLMR